MNNGEVNTFNTPIFGTGEVGGNNIIMTTEKKNSKLPFLIGGGVLLVLLIFILVYIFFLRPKPSELVVLVAPEIAEIKVDGKVYKNGNYPIPSGTHSVEISADGFSDLNYDIDVEAGEPYTLFEVLDEEDSSYSESDYEILSLIAESERAISLVNSRRRALTIFNNLPFENSEKKIRLESAVGNEDCENSSLCLKVINSGDLAEEGAYGIVRELGYDPNDYVILYEKGEN